MRSQGYGYFCDNNFYAACYSFISLFYFVFFALAMEYYIINHCYVMMMMMMMMMTTMMMMSCQHIVDKTIIVLAKFFIQ